MTRGIVLWIAWVTVLGAATAWADDAAMSRFHYDQATRYYDRGQYERAVQQFFQAQRLSPNPRTVYNIGLCFHQLRRPEDAFLFLSEYLAQKDAADGAEARREYARKTVAELEKRTARVEVRSEPAGARIFVDQREHGAWGETPRVLALRAGTHRIWVEVPGYRPAGLEVEAVRGQVAQVTLAPEQILGRMKLDAQVEAAARVLDGLGEVVAEGTTPLSVDLPPARYEAELTAPGHRPYRRTIRIRPEGEGHHRATMEPLPPPRGALTISANVNRAVVELGGEPVGFTPLALTDLPEGPQQVRVTSPEMLPWEGEVEVRSGKQAWAQVKLAPRPRGASPIAWTLGGIGVSMLAAGTLTGGLAIKKRRNFSDLTNMLAPDGADLRNTRDEGLLLNRATDGLIALGVAALVAGVVIYFITDDRTARSSTARVSGKAAP